MLKYSDEFQRYDVLYAPNDECLWRLDEIVRMFDEHIDLYHVLFHKSWGFRDSNRHLFSRIIISISA